MSFLLPRDELWGVANWISLAFFTDAEQFLEQAPLLAEDLKFCRQAGLDTIDLQDADLATLNELNILIERVLTMNRSLRGSNFHEPEWFPVYLSHVERLDKIVKNIIS